MTWKRYLLWFAHEHVELRTPELKSLLSLLNIPMRFIEEPEDTNPYWLVEFKSEEDVKRLANRSVSLRSCIELWAWTKDIAELHRKLQLYPQDLMESHFLPEKSFKIEVETFCRHFSQKEKVDKIESFSYLPVKGRVKLKDPDVCLMYIEYYGTNANNPPEKPYFVFFGRWVANGLRQLIKKLSLKDRKFIGNTSMDAQLSLLMANQAQVKNGDLVLDPFVGTGSLLVAAAQFGAYVFGSDIDYLMLHARTRPSRITQKKREHDESIKANMEQYGLKDKYLDVVVNDFAMPVWRKDLIFDAIITDPPYGIREATERIGTAKENFTISDEHLPTHIPAKIEYGLTEIYCDLLQFSAKHLKLGGRLVCWFPVFRENYTEESLPNHKCLKLVANSEQILSKLTSRRLLTYEKITETVEHEASIENDNSIMDFRMKYFEIREETRKERRMKKATLREKDRLEYVKRKENDSSTK